MQHWPQWEGSFKPHDSLMVASLRGVSETSYPILGQLARLLSANRTGQNRWTLWQLDVGSIELL